MSYPKLPLETKWPIDNVELSLVIPAYNEESRLESSIHDTIKFLKTLKIKYEIILVNDGSRDKTWDVIKSTMKKYPNEEIFGVTYNKNGGKGWAVSSGMKYAKGKYILMLDADGATKIEDYLKLRQEMTNIEKTQTEGGDEKGILVIGSRQSNLEESQIKNLIGLKNIKDTQCGFKLFSRLAAHKIFFNMHLVRWAFDVEMLYIAQRSSVKIKEIPVSFEDVAGSKLNVFTASISFLRDFFAMLTFYNTGYWNIN